MKRWLRIFWARVRCNLYVLRRIISPMGQGVCEATLYDDNDHIVAVLAVRSDFMTLRQEPSGGMRVVVKLAAIDRIFYQVDFWDA